MGGREELSCLLSRRQGCSRRAQRGGMSGRARDRERDMTATAFAISRPQAHSSARFQRAREHPPP